MNVMAFRFRTPATPDSRRLVPLIFIALIAVLFGLLAMHSITTSSASAAEINHAPQVVSDSAPESMAIHVHMLVTDSMPASTSSAMPDAEPLAISAFAPVCTGACELDCLIFGSMCTMTTAAVLTLALHQQNPPRVLPAATMRISALVAQHLTLPKPPSLSVLSISRT
jgi:hypothetical protein